MIFVHITDHEGEKIVAQQDHDPVHGSYPTSQWEKGETIEESYDFWVPADVPAGVYTIRIGLYIPEGEALKVMPNRCPTDWDGRRVIIGHLEIE